MTKYLNWSIIFNLYFIKKHGEGLPSQGGNKLVKIVNACHFDILKIPYITYIKYRTSNSLIIIF